MPTSVFLTEKEKSVINYTLYKGSITAHAPNHIWTVIAVHYILGLIFMGLAFIPVDLLKYLV